MNLPVSRQAAAVSLALAIASLTSPASLAQTTPIDNVIVTASRMPQRATDIIPDTTVIHTEEIVRSGAGSVADVLQRQRGIEITRNGSAGAATSVYLRGANSNQVVVLLDGVRVGSSTTGAASWNAVPLTAIERIEIVYGPLTTLYGADAIGGVIQIFSRKGAGAPEVGAAAGLGSDGTRQYEASVHGGTSGEYAVRYALSAGHEESDGFSATRPGAWGHNPDDDGYRRQNLTGNLSLDLAPGHRVGAQVLHSRLRAQYDGGAGSFDTHSIQDLNTAAVYLDSLFLPNWRSLVQLSRSEDKQGSYASASSASQIDTRQDELNWQNTIALGRDTLQLLYSHREEEVMSSSAAALSRTRTTNSYAAAYSARRASHLFDLSARHDRSGYGGRTTGAAGYGYDFGNGLRATASAGTSFRAPTFNELYYPGYGNPANKPEKGRNLEAGLRYDRARVQFDAIYYRNRVTDLIATARPCPTSLTGSCAYNIADATLEGVTVGARARLWKLNLRASLDWQDPRDNSTGKQLARRARRHGSFGADTVLGTVKAGAELLVSGERFDDAANARTLGGYGLLNLYAIWRVTPDVSLLVRADNVTDKHYELARNYGTAGRTWYAALRYGMR